MMEDDTSPIDLSKLRPDDPEQHNLKPPTPRKVSIAESLASSYYTTEGGTRRKR